MVNLGPNAVLFDPNTGHFTTTKGQVSCVIHRLDIGVHGPTIKCRSMGLSEAEGFLRERRFPPLLHRLMVSAKKNNAEIEAI